MGTDLTCIYWFIAIIPHFPQLSPVCRGSLPSRRDQGADRRLQRRRRSGTQSAEGVWGNISNMRFLCKENNGQVFAQRSVNTYKRIWLKSLGEWLQQRAPLYRALKLRQTSRINPFAGEGPVIILWSILGLKPWPEACLLDYVLSCFYLYLNRICCFVFKIIYWLWWLL